MLDVKVDAIGETRAFDPKSGKQMAMHYVTYHVGDFGPFTLTLPLEEFNVERINELLDAKRKVIAALPGVLGEDKARRDRERG